MQTVSDVIFIGTQEQSGGLPGLPMYNDKVTGTTFVVGPGETLEQAVERKRKQFEEYGKEF